MPDFSPKHKNLILFQTKNCSNAKTVLGAENTLIKVYTASIQLFRERLLVKSARSTLLTL